MGAWYRKPAPKYGFFQEWKINKDNDFYIEHYQKEVLDELNVDKVLMDLQLLVPKEMRKSPIWTSGDVQTDSCIVALMSSGIII
jgi:hypothetical protein